MKESKKLSWDLSHNNWIWVSFAGKWDWLIDWLIDCIMLCELKKKRNISLSLFICKKTFLACFENLSHFHLDWLLVMSTGGGQGEDDYEAQFSDCKQDFLRKNQTQLRNTIEFAIHWFFFSQKNNAIYYLINSLLVCYASFKTDDDGGNDENLNDFEED